MTTISDPEIMDCACVIHGTGYDWIYVKKLYNMLRRNSQRDIHLHVYTEPERFVPDRMSKHLLTNWPGVCGPKKSWWYKMQLFNPEHHCGPLLYFDLDVIITKNIDWIWDLDIEYLWAINDFRRIFRPNQQDINSSMMYWDTRKYSWVWKEFQKHNLQEVMKKYAGDQDFLSAVIKPESRKFFDIDKIKSYRWEVKDGGFNTRTRMHNHPNSGAIIDDNTSVVIFHGQPKPHKIDDPVLRKFWEGPYGRRKNQLII